MHFARAERREKGAVSVNEAPTELRATLCRCGLSKNKPYCDYSHVDGDLLVKNLHGHHHWEDHSFFPELLRADERFEAGLDTLESDHLALDHILGQLTRQGNRVVKLMQLDEAQAYEEAGALHGVGALISAFLERHLSDEEDLAVPLLLHHKLRG